MKHEDKQFDDFLRSRLEPRTFEMKDQYWENAQELINAQRKGRSKGILTFTFSAVALVSLSAALLWKNSSTLPAAQSAGREQTYIAQVTPSNNTGAAIAKPSSGSGAEALPGTNNNAFAAGVSAGINTVNNNNNTDNSGIEATSVTVMASYTTPAIHTADAVDANNRSSNGNVLVSEISHTKRAGRDKGNSTGNIADVSEEMTSGETKRNDVLTSLIISGRFYQPSPVTLELDLFNPQATFLPYSDIREQKSFLTAEGGVNCYNTGSGLLKSFNISGGLRYYFFVSPKIGLSGGISYSRIHQNLGSRIYRDIDYSFGRQTTETKITTQRLDYIELPVDVHYRVKGSHFATAGALLGYAIQSGEYVDGESNSTRTNGHMSAINRFDIQLHAGYTYLLNNRYAFSAGYYFGLMDVSNNTVYKSNRFDRNSGMRITLGYKIF